MSSKHGANAKRNKTYKPRRTNVVAAFAAIQNKHLALVAAAKKVADQLSLREHLMQPMHSEQKYDLRMACRVAMAALVVGNGDDHDWNTVVCTLNIAVVLCERGLGGEYESDIVRALDAAFKAKQNYARTLKWAFDSDSVEAINHAFDVHEAQIEIATTAEAMSALAEVTKRVESGNVYREAV